MVGVSVHGLLGVDAQLQQSALAVRQQHLVQYHSVRVAHDADDCEAAPAAENTRL